MLAGRPCNAIFALPDFALATAGMEAPETVLREWLTAGKGFELAENAANDEPHLLKVWPADAIVPDLLQLSALQLMQHSVLLVQSNSLHSNQCVARR